MRCTGSIRERLQFPELNHELILKESTGCFIPSVTFQTIVISGIDGPILKPFNVVIIHMVRFDIMYGNP